MVMPYLSDSAAEFPGIRCLLKKKSTESRSNSETESEQE